MSKKVLVIDDSSLIREKVHSILRQNGYVAYDSSGGSKALAIARDVPVDLIILDVRMPIMDGMAMYKELRSQGWGKHIPVIMLTSSDDAEVHTWMASEGLDEVKKDEAMEARLLELLENRFGAS
ncbi:MAG TPA: response regulator [Candidatus Paceibacterota bacterium]|nr:response regulator [Candidatus Paceibacterota bacterium]